jgi:hypothetical protein
MNPKLQSLYGLKFNPFRPDVPVEALYATPAVDAFLRRVQLGIADGGYIMISGDPGTGKSVVLRLLTQRLQALRDVMVGTIEHPQSRTMDFYRELGDLFAVPLQCIISRLPVTVEPTAHASLVEIIVILYNSPNGDEIDDGKLKLVQLFPSQCWTIA